MKIRTLWHPGEDGNMPWLMDAVDEYTEEDHGMVPPDYHKKTVEYPQARELIIHLSDKIVEALFDPPEAKGKVDEKLKMAKDTLKSILDNLNNEDRYGIETVRRGLAEQVHEALAKLETP